MDTRAPYETLAGKSTETAVREIEQLIGAATLALHEGSLWLIGQRAPIGPVLRERDISYVYKGVWGLYEAGVERFYVTELLDWLHVQARQPNGDFFLPEEPTDHRVDTRAYRELVFLKYAALLDHPIIHDPVVLARIKHYQDAATGGCFYYIGEDPQQPLYPDFLAVGDTAFFGELALAAGWKEEALRAGRWMLRMVQDNRRHMEQEGCFYCLTDRTGQLITAVGSGEKIFKTVNNRDANQMGWNIGCAMAFLADLYAAFRSGLVPAGPEQEKLEDAISEALAALLDFEDSMPVYTYFYPSKCKVAWGIGQILDVWLKYGLETTDRLDQLYRIGKRVFVHTFLGTQRPDGSWPAIHYPLTDDAPELQYDYRCIKGFSLPPTQPLWDSQTCSYLPAVEVTGEILGEIAALMAGLRTLLHYYRR